jgi:hypothetical protein
MFYPGSGSENFFHPGSYVLCKKGSSNTFFLLLTGTVSGVSFKIPVAKFHDDNISRVLKIIIRKFHQKKGA